MPEAETRQMPSFAMSPDPAITGRRVVIVHDYLTQRGGAERVVLALLEAFPRALLVTSFYDPKHTFEAFRNYEIKTLAPRRLGFLRRDPRWAFWLLPWLFLRHEVRNADVVICTSSGWAHLVRTTAPKLVYCFTPARWLYLPHDYFGSLPAVIIRLLAVSLKPLAVLDRRRAHSADKYLTSSTVVQARILQHYGIKSDIVPPPITVTPDGPVEAVPGLSPGFWLAASRSRGYKNIDAVVNGVLACPSETLVVTGNHPPNGVGSERVRFAGVVPEAQLKWLYSNCRGVISVSYEDFGLTPVEGYAFDAPALCLRAGGFLDTIVEGVTGQYIEAATAEAVATAVTKFNLPSGTGAFREVAARYSIGNFHSAVVAEVRALLGQDRR